jgi:hypothetical protein
MEKKLRCKSKLPLFIDRLQRHLNSRWPLPSAQKISSLCSGRAVEADIQPEKKLRYKRKVPLHIDRLQRHSHSRLALPSGTSYKV